MRTPENIFDGLQKIGMSEALRSQMMWNKLVERLVSSVSPLLHPEDVKTAKNMRKMVKRLTQIGGDPNIQIGKEEKKEKGEILGVHYSDKESGERLILRKPGEREGSAISDAYWLLYYPPRMERAEGKVSSLSVMFYPERTERGAEYLTVSSGTVLPPGGKMHCKREYHFRHN